MFFFESGISILWIYKDFELDLGISAKGGHCGQVFLKFLIKIVSSENTNVKSHY